MYATFIPEPNVWLIPNMDENTFNAGTIKKKINITIIIGLNDLKEKLLTILAKNGTPIYTPIIIGIYHIFNMSEFFKSSNSFIKFVTKKVPFRTKILYTLYITIHTSLTINNGNKLFL